MGDGCEAIPIFLRISLRTQALDLMMANAAQKTAKKQEDEDAGAQSSEPQAEEEEDETPLRRRRLPPPPADVAKTADVGDDKAADLSTKGLKPATRSKASLAATAQVHVICFFHLVVSTTTEDVQQHATT